MVVSDEEHLVQDAVVGPLSILALNQNVLFPHRFLDNQSEVRYPFGLCVEPYSRLRGVGNLAFRFPLRFLESLEHLILKPISFGPAFRFFHTT
jgi:hypothetical protein